MSDNHNAATQALQGGVHGLLGAAPLSASTLQQLQPAIANLPPEQIAAIIQKLPEMFRDLSDGENLKEAAATLSNLAATGSFTAPGGAAPAPGSAPPGLAHLGAPGVYPPPLLPPGPSSHPNGPPNLGQHPLVLAAAQTAAQQQEQQQDGSGGPDGITEEEDGDDSGPISGGGRRGGAKASGMSSEDWARQRKDNHKEVERRRRGNINDGINELGRIVPNGTGEKAKGAILQRAVQYIHHLKENEARNIEKWTLEKLLMDQAMGDLQSQLEDMRRMWEDEHGARARAEAEIEVLRGVAPGLGGSRATPDGPDQLKRKADGSEDDASKRQKLD